MMTDYYMDKARAEQRADRIRMSEAKQHPISRPPLFPKTDENQYQNTLYRRLFISVAFVILVVVMLLNTNPASAQQTINTGDGEPFAETMLPFTLGRYYFLKGDYEKAVEYFSEAVETLPVEVYEYDSTFANLYLALGDAQTAAGLNDEASESYALYVDYAGEEADLDQVVFSEDALAQLIINE